MPRAPLSVRHHAARRRADQRRRFHAARQARDHRACSTSSASTMSRAAIPAPIRPTRSCSPSRGMLQRDLHRLRHDAAARPLGLERSGPRGAARRQGRRDLLRRQVLGLSRARRARDHARGKPRLDPRQRAGRQGQGPRGAARLRAFLRRLQGQSGLCAGLRQGRLRGGRALGRAVRHQRRHAAARGRGDRRARWSSTSPATMSASTPTTTPSRRWRIRSPRCAPARARSRARSTASASAAATPISSRSSRR